jgi:predicted ATPase
MDMPPTNPPPIALTSLKIRDFRGIEHLDLDFRGPDGFPNNLIVLAGPNGSGKTAVLEAALIAVGGHKLKLAVGPRGKKAIRRGAADYLIEAQLTLRGEESTVADSSKISSPDRTDSPPVWYFSSWRAPNLVGAVNVSVGKPGRRPAKTDPNRLLNVKQQLVNAAAVQSFRAQRPLYPVYSRWIERINEGWKKFYPDHDDEFAVNLIEPEDEGAGAFEVIYTRRNSHSLSVDDLSAGQLELFLFLAALVLNDDRQGLVFIDEPELHLDPQWHAPIVRALMDLQPSAQFIVATHSPEIYDAAMSYERHFLVPEDDPRARAWPGVGARAEA